jgi:hypothetical protein
MMGALSNKCEDANGVIYGTWIIRLPRWDVGSLRVGTAGMLMYPASLYISTPPLALVHSCQAPMFTRH